MPNSNLSEEDRLLAMRIADLFQLHPADRIALILCDAQRMAVERCQARERQKRERHE